MFHAVLLHNATSFFNPMPQDLIFPDFKKALEALKKYKGSRMKKFKTYEDALQFLRNPKGFDNDVSYSDMDTSATSQQDLVASLENLSLEKTKTTATDEQPADEDRPEFPSAKPPLLNNLRRKIEAGAYETVEEIIWSNPRSLITCCDSAVYLMAGPKYNACHISARANKPDILALVLDTVTNFKFLRKLYPKESDANLQDRVNHLLDSYLNTPDPRQGNTPLHFACKLGHYRVVRVLLTFEGCDLSLRDSNGLTAEESACSQFRRPTGADGDDNDIEKTKAKIVRLFKHQLHMPAFRDQLRKRLTMERRRRSNVSLDSSMDTSYSDIDDSFIIINDKSTIDC